MSRFDRFHELRRSALGVRITRYALGSIVAAATSAIVFAILFVLHVGTTTDSICAFVAGAIPNWILNRRWAWRRRGRPEFGREVLGYAATSIVSLVLTSLSTSWTNARVQSIPAHHGIRVILVTASYLAVFAVLFVAKFALYEFWVFSEHSRIRAALRSWGLMPAVKVKVRPDRTVPAVNPDQGS
ncbi:MAG TPA: GtrA family protein [Solirubrobacteraceae bacterium]|nr:GtrA family protein [Solirubrobacteraceae bacterium]